MWCYLGISFTVLVFYSVYSISSGKMTCSRVGNWISTTWKFTCLNQIPDKLYKFSAYITFYPSASSFSIAIFIACILMLTRLAIILQHSKHLLYCSVTIASCWWFCTCSTVFVSFQWTLFKWLIFLLYMGMWGMESCKAFQE